MGLPEIRIEEPVRFSFHCLNFLCLVPEYVLILVFHYREFVDVFKCGPAISMRQQNSTRGCFLLSRLARIFFILSGKNSFKVTGTRPFFHILLESIEVFFHCRLSVTFSGVRQYHRRLPSDDSLSLPRCCYGSGLGGCGPPPYHPWDRVHFP